MAIDWDVDFFYGENEAALLASTLNDIPPSDLERWKNALKAFMDNVSSSSLRILDIVFDGHEDVLLKLSDGTILEISGSETTFGEILEMLDK